MTIERTRELLGDKVKSMTDQEVSELIQKYARLADIVLDQLQKHIQKDYSEITVPQPS